MTDWKIFSFEVERPAAPKEYTEADRQDLEKCIAKQISYLLAHYGETEDLDIDICNSLEIEDSKTFVALGLETITMDDDESVLNIEQVPVVAGQLLTEPGTHGFTLENEDGSPVLGAAVLDPSRAEDGFVISYDGQLLPIETLAECVDAFDVVMTAFYNDPDANRNLIPFDPSMYPLPLSDPDFEAIVAEF